MLRTILAAVAGIIVWGIIVTLLNLGLRHGWPDYAAVEKAMTFTVPMMAARLGISGIASLVSGYSANAISREGRAAFIAGLFLLACFIPIHYMLFDRFPLWYHATFLISLPVLSVVGGRFAR
jgi:hypothetical protein